MKYYHFQSLSQLVLRILLSQLDQQHHFQNGLTRHLNQRTKLAMSRRRFQAVLGKELIIQANP